jgi:basic membrane protein A
MTNFGPKAYLTSIIDNWGPYYVALAKAVLDGTWKSADTWDGFKPGMVQMAAFKKAIPANVIALAKKTQANITSGKLFPFTGEIKDQDGKVRVKAGAKADDGLLAGMNFYVQSIDGAIPKHG